LSPVLRLASIAALLASGCGSALEIERIEWPTLGSGVQAVILAIESEAPLPGEQETLRLEALEESAVATSVLRFDLEETRPLQLSMLTYAEPLASYGLTPGRVAPSTEITSRPLPDPASVLVRAHPGSSWAEGAPSDRLRRARIAAFDVLGCWEHGGCLADSLLDHCLLPCPPEPAVAPPTPPDPPIRPTILTAPCPGTATAALGLRPLAVCEPARPKASCGAGEAQPPDLDQCVRIGSPCAPGFPSVPAPVVYVDDDATIGGDGSLARPYPMISDALRDSPGSNVAIAAGHYAEALEILVPTKLVGACADQVVIETVSPTITARAEVEISNLTIAGGAPGIAAALGGTVVARGIAIEGADQGIEVRGGSLDAIGIAIRSARVYGVGVFDGGIARVARSTIEDVRGAAVFGLGAGSRATIDEVVIRRVRSLGDTQGAGVVIADGATALFARSLIEGVETRAIFVTGATSTVVASDLVVRLDDETSTLERDALALGVADRARLEGRRIEAHRLLGGIALDNLATASLEDLAFLEPLGFDATAHDSTIRVVEGSQLEVTRARIESALGLAIQVETGSKLTIADGTTENNALGESVRLEVGELELERFTISGCRFACFRSFAGPNRIKLTDFEIGSADSAGLHVGGATFFEAERLRLIGNLGDAFNANSGTDVRITDLEVAGVRLNTVGKTSAVNFKPTVKVALERFAITDSEVVGLQIEVDDLELYPQRIARGLVRGNRFGVVFLAEPALASRVLPLVRFVDNETLTGIAEAN
jgi:hypothetical protein